MQELTQSSRNPRRVTATLARVLCALVGVVVILLSSVFYLGAAQGEFNESVAPRNGVAIMITFIMGCCLLAAAATVTSAPSTARWLALSCAGAGLVVAVLLNEVEWGTLTLGFVWGGIAAALVVVSALIPKECKPDSDGSS
jgi:hypothetical protein